jgi:hypothetical protein
MVSKRFQPDLRAGIHSRSLRALRPHTLILRELLSRVGGREPRPDHCAEPVSGLWLPDPEAESLEQARDAARVHLELVAGAELAEDARLGLRHPAEVDQLVEEALEACGRDDLEQARGFVARVPERVPLVAWLEDQVARRSDDDVVAEQSADAAFEHVAVLVLTEMTVQRSSERTRRHRMLDQREAAARLVGVDHEPDADAAEESGLAVLWSHDPGRDRLHLDSF